MNNETVETWKSDFLKERKVRLEKEIEDVIGAIDNERGWELGYGGKEMNPHTGNIANLTAYKEWLQSLLD